MPSLTSNIAHPAEDCHPLVWVVEAADIVVYLALEVVGNHKHVGAPSLQSHRKMITEISNSKHVLLCCFHPPKAHSSQGGRWAMLTDAQREHAVLNGANSAQGSLMDCRRPES